MISCLTRSHLFLFRAFPLRAMLSQVLVLLLFASQLASAAPGWDQGSVRAPDWDWSWRKPDQQSTVEAANRLNPSPRYEVLLALFEARRDPSAAISLLEKVENAVPNDPDATRLAAVLACSLSAYDSNPIQPQVCEQRMAVLPDISHPLPRALAHLHAGIWFANRGEYVKAKEANDTAIALALDTGHPLMAAGIENNQGLTYLFRGLPAQALKIFEAALRKIGDSGASNQQRLLGNITSNIAWAHLEQGKVEAASELLQEIVNTESYDRYKWSNFVNEINLACVTGELGNPKAGYDRLRKVLSATAPSRVIHKAYAYTIMGELQIALGMIDEGIASFERALEYGELVGKTARYDKAKLRFAEALITLNRLDEAQILIEEGIAAQDTATPTMNLARGMELSAELLRLSGNRQDAASAAREAHRIQAEVLGAEYEQDLAALGKSLELANKTHELAVVQQQKEQSDLRAERERTLRNQVLLTGLLLVLIFYLVGQSHYERKVALTAKRANAELESKVSDRTAALELEMAQRLEVESQKVVLAESLAEAEKLQALGQLTSGVAHDFNNLMTVVTLSAEQLQSTETKEDLPNRKHVENILNAAESAADITASLLAYARKQPLTPELTELETFVRESLPLFESTLGESITLETTLTTGTVLVDRGQLTTAIINLLLNAKEAQQDGGRVLLEVRTDAASEDIKEDANGKQCWASIAVTDFGQGMSKSELQRATQPFYTTKAEQHGTGLGLSMVDGFARQSGGRLQLDSTEGLLTTVTLLIPLHANVQQLKAVGSANTPRLPGGGLVLIVDDQPTIRTVLKGLLSQMGHDTLSAANATEALNLLTRSRIPDLLITDLMMPGNMDGQQLAAEVNKRYPELPVLLMSGYSSEVDIDVEFLPKPFSLDEFRDAMGRAINRKSAAIVA